MARRFNFAVAATAALAVVLMGCSSLSSDKESTNNGGNSAGIGQQAQAIDKNAKGPAPEVAGSRKGGNITVYAETMPITFDPTDIYYTDSIGIGKLLFRTPTQFAIRDGKPTLVPDLTDVGTVSTDKLTWTFKMQQGIKYEDGTEVRVEDLAYAIKRSFAHDVFANGPTYQLIYFKDSDEYKGPYKSGTTYTGVETQGTDTLIIHLARPFGDLPFYMSFPTFTPIPEARDTKRNYKNKPLATGPYAFDAFTPGSSLKLRKNTYWDADTDAARHQYPDTWEFKWGGERVKTQLQVLASNGADANAIHYDNIDATLIPQLSDDKKAQLVQGESPCTIVLQLDTRKIPLEVRKAIAKAYPYDQIHKAAGNDDLTAEKASTILPPSVPGYVKYNPVPDLDNTGEGDTAAAKEMLAAAGKIGFELSWYYDNTLPLSQRTNKIRTQALKAAGFKVKAIGVATADVGTKLSDHEAPVNMGQGSSIWCSDWPTGTSWFPVLFQSHSIADGTSWGMLSDETLDAEIDAISDLPTEEATSKWAALDEKIMGMYVALPRYYNKMAVVQGTNVGGTEGDPTVGMPLYVNMFAKS